MPTAILEVAVEVWQCPLGSGARGGGPACAHWDLELAVEVRLCPLGSGLAVEVRQAGSGEVEAAGGNGGGRRRRRRTALIKSNNPHLAGGEKTTNNRGKGKAAKDGEEE